MTDDQGRIGADDGLSTVDREYYERRHAQEIAWATAALTPDIAAAHRTLAARYAELLAGSSKP